MSQEDVFRWLEANPEKLTLLFNTEFPPIEFASPAGAFTGMGADVIALIEERLGVTFIKTPSDDWNAHLAALQRGACAVAPTVVATPERERYAFFTTPYAVVPVVIITSRAVLGRIILDDLTGSRVAVVSGYATEHYVRDISGGRFEVVKVPDVSAGLRAVSFGQVDALVESLAVAGYVIEQEGIPNLRVAGRTDYAFAESIGVSRKYPLLFSAIQKALDTIEPGELAAIRRRWIALDISGWLDPQTRWLFQVINVFVTLLIGVLLAVSLVLRRRLKEKVADLKDAQQELREQTEVIRLAVGRAQAGAWDYRPPQQRSRFSEQWFAMLGYATPGAELSIEEYRAFVHPEDWPVVEQSLTDYISGGGQGQMEAEGRLRRVDGDWCWVYSTGRAVEWDDQGTPTRIIGLDVNIQSRKEAQEQVQQSEAQFRAIFENAPYVIVISNPEDGRLLDANNEFLVRRGIGREAIVDSSLWDFSTISKEEMGFIINELQQNKTIRNREARVTLKDGSSGFVIYSATLLDSQGQKQVLTMTVDVTEIRRAAEALQQSEARFRELFRMAPVPLADVSRDGRILAVNDRFVHLIGYGTDEMPNLEQALELTLNDPGFRRQVTSAWQAALERAIADHTDMPAFESPLLCRDGQVRTMVVGTQMISDSILVSFFDITERKMAEEAMDRERRQLLSIFDNLNEIIYVSDPFIYEILFANRHLRELIGKDPTGGLCYRELQDFAEPCDFCTNRILFASGGGPYRWEYHNPVTHTDVAIVDQLIRWTDGRDVRLEIALDITERKRAEQALRESERKLRSIFAAMTDVILIFDGEGRCIEVAPTDTVFLYRPPDEVQGKTLDELFPPEKAAEFLGAIRGALSRKAPVFLDYELTIGQRQVWFASSIAPLSEERVIWVARDITERRQAQAERENLQTQLHQSQKLEAVGILAGGVAHDFNNMLGAIMGYAELALGAMSPTDPFRRNLERILDAAQRSANLTRQLLAFARRQTIEPVVFDLNQAVGDILKMIQRLIGENIELVWRPGEGPCTVRMDPSQLDQILVNLCVNARDAIGGVGRISIETAKTSFDEAYCTAHVECNPGEHVLLAVSDDGCGMDRQTLEHIFEPFYTTKELGQGSGMGLATVYGAVRQNEGFISVYSEPGQGTTFRIYLPLHAAIDLAARAQPGEDIPRSCGETLLIVEDDPTLLEMGMMMLQHLGYTVLSAATPQEALRIAEAEGLEIHLVLTDVVMPEMNGRELSERLHSLRPAARYLFMSGYTADVIAHQGVLDRGLNFIQKPFSLKDLALKVRQVLD